MSGENESSKRVIVAYLTLGGLFTLGASLIWAINTIFLIRVGGLDLFQTMLVNGAFTVSQMVFEVPTGVVADTVGRRASILLSMLVLAVSTVLYVLTPVWGWGMAGFIVSSVLLGIGYTFQTGSVEAWLVDALDATGWALPKDRVFAWGQIAASAGMLLGSVLGGVLGQFNLFVPYLVRAGLLVVCFVAALILVHDSGFEPRALKLSSFGSETRHILSTGMRYGWGHPVIRPLLWTSALAGGFAMYGFYAWQPYVLELLGRDYVWLLGIVQALSSAAGILGNALVGRTMRTGAKRRDPARVLIVTSLVSAGLVACTGAVGLLATGAGVVPAGIAIVLWVGWGVVFGLSTPIRMSYINEHIPSKERATVLSLDALFGDGGAAVGQPVFGWVSQRFSIALAWLFGGALVAFAAPLYARSAEAAAEERRNRGDGQP